MNWQKYDLVFRLMSPLHIGWRKTGNLMQTRGYVPGKNLWAALTARLTRDYDNGVDGQRYVQIGKEVQKHFRFTYLYPAVCENGNPRYPWEDDFDYLFLDSYAGTALNYDNQAAEEAMLHETEFIAPRTRTNEPVYLKGSLFVQDNLPDCLCSWRKALKELQIGGEQGYGWGKIKMANCSGGELIEGEPEVAVTDKPILAHLKASGVTGVSGLVEPLVGWERNNTGKGEPWQLSKTTEICYAPGTKCEGRSRFRITNWGVLEHLEQ